MESILQEKRISFKEFEKKIYQFVCGLGQEIAKTMLENYDDHLAKNRDTLVAVKFEQRVSFPHKKGKAVGGGVS